jgi:hypothetical protein
MVGFGHGNSPSVSASRSGDCRDLHFEFVALKFFLVDVNDNLIVIHDQNRFLFDGSMDSFHGIMTWSF